MNSHISRLRQLLLAASFGVLAALLVPSTGLAFGHYSYGYSYSPGFGYSQPYLGPAVVQYSTFAPAYMSPGYETLSDEDMYLGSKRKGDRLMKRGQFSAATREYRNAVNRATKFWGARSQQAKESGTLLAKAQQSFQKYGDAARNQDFGRAKSKGDRYFDRGDFRRALAQYEDALKRAHTDEQAQSAVAMVVRAKEALEGPTSTKMDENRDLRVRGDEAMEAGNYQQALGFYASALTRSIKVHGADSAQTQALTRSITRAQEGLTGRLPVQDDFRVAD